MVEAALHLRDRRGEWRPREPLAAPPIYVWPPKPVAFVKWFFGYRGYLFPWTAIYALIAFLTWRFLTPGLDRMRHLEAGWVLMIFSGNLVLLCCIVTAWHWPLYVRKAQGVAFKFSDRWLAQNNGSFLFKSQLAENVFWTLVSAVPIWTAYQVAILWAQANGLVPYVSWRAHPIYCVFLMCCIPLFHEVHFYVIHRWIHRAPLYRYVHSLHHKNVNPGPWSGLSMHPVEHLLYFSGVLLYCIVPSHPLHVIFHLQFAAFGPSQGHCGFDRVLLSNGRSFPTDTYMHYLHHKYFIVNYGGDGTVPLDQWFGTFHDGTVAADAMLKDSRARRRVAEMH